MITIQKGQIGFIGGNIMPYRWQQVGASYLIGNRHVHMLTPEVALG